LIRAESAEEALLAFIAEQHALIILDRAGSVPRNRKSY
jgi:hypothetical protein